MSDAPVFTHRFRVAFADTDLAGIVHFSNFFRYMENTEHEFIRSLGFSIHPEGSGATDLEVFPGFGWPRISATCDYKKPLRFEEELNVELYIREVDRKTIRYGFHFLQDGALQPSAVGELKVICVIFDEASKRMRATDIPDGIRERVEAARSAV